MTSGLVYDFNIIHKSHWFILRIYFKPPSSFTGVAAHHGVSQVILDSDINDSGEIYVIVLDLVFV